MNDLWETPDHLFKALNYEFEFDIDTCANEDTHKVDKWYGNTPEGFIDALKVDWYQEGSTEDTFWMNPPYSRGNIDLFMEKAYKESRKGAVVVCLVRDDPSTNWYQKWVDGKAVEVRRLQHRVKFKGANNCYNFPICVVIYEPSDVEYTMYELWDWKDIDYD